MAKLDHDNLPVGMRLTSDGDSYEIGLTVEGAWIVFGRITKGALDADVAEAKETAAQEQPETAAEPAAEPAA